LIVLFGSKVGVGMIGIVSWNQIVSGTDVVIVSVATDVFGECENLSGVLVLIIVGRVAVLGIFVVSTASFVGVV
jgi:hypothetical protein